MTSDGGLPLVRQLDRRLGLTKAIAQVLPDPAALALAKNWPTPMVWSGYEIGVAATFPHEVIEHDFEYVKHHPLKEAYYLYNPPRRGIGRQMHPVIGGSG